MFKNVSKEELIKEIEELTKENTRLKRQIGDSRGWTSIRELIIFPELQRRGIKKYDRGVISSAIGNVVKAHLSISKLSAIDEHNHEEAKRVTLGILDVLKNQ
ncbi:hypothetical protein [Clostridium baratii]|uniref:hypothetical protein n=1 Tax=Clostridium baratii TaxID=1561 RepID=UPI0030D38B0A